METDLIIALLAISLLLYDWTFNFKWSCLEFSNGSFALLKFGTQNVIFGLVLGSPDCEKHSRSVYTFQSFVCFVNNELSVIKVRVKLI